MVADPRSDVDVMMGTGGTPEGVIAACAIKGVGGQMLCRLDPQSYVEKENIERAGVDIREILSVERHYPRRRRHFLPPPEFPEETSCAGCSIPGTGLLPILSPSEQKPERFVI